MSSLFEDGRRRGRHGSWEDTPNVSVMPAGGSEEDDFVCGFVEYGADDRYVWKMSERNWAIHQRCGYMPLTIHLLGVNLS